MPSQYDLLRRACGLSQQEAAHFHDARLDTVNSWCLGRRPVPPGVIDEMRGLYRVIVYAAGVLGAKIDALKRSEGEPVVLGLAHDDQDARSLGFPCASAHGIALAVAIAKLPEGVPVELWPRSEATLTADVNSEKIDPKRWPTSVDGWHDCGLIDSPYDEQFNERTGQWRHRRRRMFADAMAHENELGRRRFIHATRPKGPMSMDQAAELSRRMAEAGDQKTDWIPGHAPGPWEDEKP